tara:strand:+ start:2063 stop:2338 length:276 start_codon:yes stop_codon:yes gene_type:complete
VDHTLRWLADNSMSELKVHFSLHEIDGEMLLRLKKTSKIYAAFSHHPLRDTFSIKLDALRQDALKFGEIFFIRVKEEAFETYACFPNEFYF